VLTRRIAQPLDWLLDGVVAAIAATGIPPNVLTWCSLVLNLWAAVLFARGRFAAAGGAMLLAGFCDIVDGRVARRQGRVTKFGGFLDSIFDRYSDLALFLGLLVYYSQVNRFAYACLVGASMAGAVMVSYARARAESLIGKHDVGFWDRPERIVLMILGALFNRMPLALWILAIGPNITVIHHIVFTWQRTRRHPEEVVMHSVAHVTSVPAVGTGNNSSSFHPETPAVSEPALLSRTAQRGG
jgi:CDP-diacylglycerol--glycerol-3-phosphate 3-phosphatidyltransferase